MTNSLQKLQWDSDFFGFPVGKTVLHSITDVIQIQSLLNEISKSEFELIYIFCDEIVSINDELNGFSLVDEKVTYSKTLDQTHAIDVDSTNIKAYTNTVPNSDLINLALDSGEYSRFKVDKNIPNHKFRELYLMWITNSCNKKFADEVFITKQGEKITGMATVKTGSSSATIGLIAVDSNFRGKSIGKKLIAKIEQYCFSKNIKTLNVVTQKQNINACKFYESTGFSINKIEKIYHFWRNKNMNT